MRPPASGPGASLAPMGLVGMGEQPPPAAPQDPNSLGDEVAVEDEEEGTCAVTLTTKSGAQVPICLLQAELQKFRDQADPMFEMYALWWDDVTAYLECEVGDLLGGAAPPPGLAEEFDSSQAVAGEKAEALAFNVPRALSEGFPKYSEKELDIIDEAISEAEGVAALQVQFPKVLAKAAKLQCQGTTFMFTFVIDQLILLDAAYSVDMTTQLLIAFPGLAPICP